MRLGKPNGSGGIEFDPWSSPSFLIKPLAKELTRLAKAELRLFGVGIDSLPVLAALKSAAALTRAGLTRLLRVEQPQLQQPHPERNRHDRR